MNNTEKEDFGMYIQSRSSYWNALITLNGIFLSVFSAIIISDIEGISILVYGIIVLSMFSLWLLLYNFRVNKHFHFELVKTSEADFNNLSTKDRDKSIKRNVNRYRFMKMRDTFIEIFFILETLLIIAIIYYQ